MRKHRAVIPDEGAPWALAFGGCSQPVPSDARENGISYG